MLRDFPKRKMIYRAIVNALFTFVVLTLLVSAPASAGGSTVCREPYVFSADVNTFVLQFTDVSESERPLSDVAKQLSLLIQHDALFSQCKYGSIAVQYLVVPPGLSERCTREAIIAMTEPQCKDGKGLILFSGTLYEESGEIFIQTDLRFLRKKTDETVVCKFKTGGDESYDFECRLPLQTVSFAPRRLTVEDVARISEAYYKNAMVRIAPDTASPGRLIPTSQLERFAYRIAELRGEWMKIESWTGGPSGWVRANLNTGFPELRQKLPELDFLEATAGYLRYRAGLEKEGTSREARYAARAVESAFANFKRRASPEEDAAPLAALTAMTGIVKLLDARANNVPDKSGIYAMFSEVGALMPYNSEAGNFKAASNFFGCCVRAGGGVERKAVVTQLQTALDLNPANVNALRNLSNTYQFLVNRKDSSTVGTTMPELNAKIISTRKLSEDIAKNRMKFR